MDECGTCRNSRIIMQCQLRMKSSQTKVSNRSYSCVFPGLVVLLLLTFLSRLNCKTPSAPAIFVFGDSLFDSGNNNKLPTLAKANFLPYGAEFIDGASGRFTNNGTLADIIAQFLGLPMPPAYESLDLRSFKGLTGVNYASAGTGILPKTGAFFGGGITFGKQVDYFQKTIEKVLQPQFGSPEELQNYLAKSIFLFSVGTNDYTINYLVPLLYNTSKIYTPQTYPKFLLGDNLAKHIERLYKLGARKIIMLEIIPFGCMPSYLRRKRSETQCVDDYNQLVSNFNTQLDATFRRLTSALPGSKLVIGKTHDFFKSMLQDPAKYGLTEIKEPCCIAAAAEICIPLLKPCWNSKEHLWWDGVHPTSAVNYIVARDCYRGSSTCSPININKLAQA